MMVYRWRKALVVAAIFGLVGVALIVITRAATSTTSLEAELGSQTNCAVDVNDTSASAQQAIKFTTCAVGGAFGLDKTGQTIPDTDYAVPAGAIFLATNGNDANAGSQSSPVKTITRAYNLVPEGGTIVMRGGTYRDWINDGNAGNERLRITSKGFAVQAYPHEQVWFDGTDVISDGWASDGAGHWKRSWSTPQFCDGNYYQYNPLNQPFDKANTASYNKGPCAHGDIDSSPQEPAVGDPQAVWINGQELYQVAKLADISATSFYYDWDARVMYLGTNPSGKTTEIAIRPTAMVLGGSNIGTRSIRGIGFKRFASNEYSNLTNAAVYVGGKSVVVFESTVFRENSGKGLSFSNPQPGSYVRGSIFASNGFNGAHANGSKNQAERNDLVLEGNVFYKNNKNGYGYGCTVSCGSAQIKMANMIGYTFRDNLMLDVVTDIAVGVWCDTYCYEGKTYNNLLVNSGDIFYELNDGGFIASNVIVNSKSFGLNVASSNVRIYNNTIINPKTIAMRVFEDSRAEFNTQNIKLFNNVVYGQPTNVNWFVNQGSVPPSTYITGLDYNSYWRQTSNTLYRWIDSESPLNETSAKTVAAFQALRPQFESHAQDIVGGADPFFVNLTDGDYRIRGNSVAAGSGGPIPADIAQALGMPTSAGQSRGAFTWPGKQ
jgi:hypothetical protein